MKALIIEDNSSLEMPLRNAFKQFVDGIEVDWASSAEEAEEKLQKEEYDLVVADYILPGMRTGVELWERFRFKAKTKWMIMSGVPINEFIEATREIRNCPVFLPKPFTRRDFERTLMGLLRPSTVRFSSRR